MDLLDLNFNYECVIRKCYNCDRGEALGADTMYMNTLFSSYVDFLQIQNPSKEQNYEAKCKEVSKYLSDAINASPLPADRKTDLISKLVCADFITIVFVLGELEILLADL